MLICRKVYCVEYVPRRAVLYTAQTEVYTSYNRRNAMANKGKVYLVYEEWLKEALSVLDPNESCKITYVGIVDGSNQYRLEFENEQWNENVVGECVE